MQGQILARPSGGVTKQMIRRIEYWGYIRRGAFPAKYKLYKNYPEKKEKIVLDKRFLKCYNIKVSSSVYRDGRDPRGGVLKWQR